MQTCSVADPHHLDAGPDPACHYDADPDPACHFDTDPDPTFYFDEDQDLDPSFQRKAQKIEYSVYFGLTSPKRCGSGSS